MLLAIDIGNTEVTLGLFKGKRLARTFRVSSETRRTADEVALLLGQVFPEARKGALSGVVLASVVPPQTPLYARAARRLCGRAPIEVGAGTPHGLAIEYLDPSAVGADRIANAVGAFDRYRAPAIIVDFGTATTFDVLLTGRRYRGGVIVPGVFTGAEQLIRRAARLGAFELKPPARVVGRTTEESLQSGVFYGAVGQVDSIVRRIAAEERIRPTVVATGGLAAEIAAHAETIDHVDPDLTLHGLRALHERAGKGAAKRAARGGSRASK
jgi:type III pantothenate kinase